MVIAVKEQNQREEVLALIAEIGLTNDQFGVRTTGHGSEELNSLGWQDHTNALVLFVTQSQPEDAVLWDPWDEQVDEDPSFMFRGKPRYLRLSKELGMMMDAMPAKDFLEAYRTDPSLQKVTRSDSLKSPVSSECLALIFDKALIPGKRKTGPLRGLSLICGCR